MSREEWRRRERAQFLEAIGARYPLPVVGYADTVGALIQFVEKQQPASQPATRPVMDPAEAARAIAAGVKDLADENWTVRERGLGVLAGLVHEPRAASALVAAMKSDRADVRALAADALGGCHSPPKQVLAALAKALGDANAVVRRAAATSLARLGPAAAAARDRLIVALDDPSDAVQARAAVALGAIGQIARPAAKRLVRGLESHSGDVQLAAAWALGRVGEVPDEALAELGKLVGSSDSDVSRRAGETLVRGHPAPERAVLVLLGHLRGTQTNSQIAAAEVLGAIGPAVREAVPKMGAQLRSLVEDRVRKYPEESAERFTRLALALAEAIGRIDPNFAVAPLLAAMDDPNAAVRKAAGDSLARCGPSAAERPEALPALIAALAAPSAEKSAAAAGVLRRIGKPAAAAVVEAAREGWGSGHVGALLDELGPDAFDGFADVLTGDDLAAALRAAAALSYSRVASGRAVPALVRAIRVGPDEARQRALAALDRIDPNVALATLRRMDRSAASALAEGAVRGGRAERLVPLLDAMGPRAVGELVKVLDGDDLLACFEAANALSHSRLAGGKAVPCLIAEMKGCGAEGQMKVLEALGRIGSPAAAALPQVLQAARHDQARVRWTAVRALGRIAPGRAEVTTALNAALRDDHWRVRDYAAEALQGPSSRPGEDQ